MFFFQAEDGIRDIGVTGVQTCALPIYAAAPPCPRRGRSVAPAGEPVGPGRSRTRARAVAVARGHRRSPPPPRSEERREGKSVDLGGRRIIKKKKIKQSDNEVLTNNVTC